MRTTFYAARARYEELLRGGVRIYEYQPANLHAKTLVVDGVWSGVGSLNFDNRSLAFNNELMLTALDSTVGRRMEEVFLADLGYSREIRLDRWDERSWTERAKEWGANLLSRVL